MNVKTPAMSAIAPLICARHMGAICFEWLSWLSRPTLVGKTLSFTHELSIFLYFLLFFYKSTVLSRHAEDGHQMYFGGIGISPTPLLIFTGKGRKKCEIWRRLKHQFELPAFENAAIYPNYSIPSNVTPDHSILNSTYRDSVHSRWHQVAETAIRSVKRWSYDDDFRTARFNTTHAHRQLADWCVESTASYRRLAVHLKKYVFHIQQLQLLTSNPTTLINK